MSQLNEYVSLVSVGFVAIAALLRWIVLIVRKTDQIADMRRDLDAHIDSCTEYRETLRRELRDDLNRIHDRLDAHTVQD
jgi:hypothetical protein